MANRALVAEALGDEVVAEIRAHLQQQKALDSDRFQEWVATCAGKFAGLRRPGRPPAKANCLRHLFAP
jgi:putative transposase